MSYEKKFIALRKRLDQLGYRQTLGIESLPLVERLFSDLLHTTNSLKNAKINNLKTSQKDGKGDASHVYDDSIEAYRVDNAKLVTENNSLHLELLKSKDEVDAVTKSMKSTMRKLEHENADLRFLNTQYIHKVKTIERESALKTETIHKLQEKNLQAVIQTPGGRKKTIPFRRQRMNIDSTLPNSLNSFYISPQPDDPYIADLVQVADDKIATLSEEVSCLKQTEEININKIACLRKQVEAREREIERLNRSLEGGRPHDVVSLEAKNRSNERLISHLNLQVDYLQQTNQELEDRIRELDEGKTRCVDETVRLKCDIDRLHNELRDIDRLAQQLEREKQEAVSVADREIHEAQMELRQTHISVQGKDSKLIDVTESNDRLVVECSELRAETGAKGADVDRLNALLDKMQADKAILGEKVQALQDNEKALVLELERYRTSPSRARRLDKSPSKLDGFIRTLEQERDHYREECDALQNMLRESKKMSGGSITPRCKSPSASCRSPSRTPKKSSSSPEYASVVRERDELQAMLNKYERHVAEVQANAKVLVQERDKTNMLYDQTNDELQRLRRDCVRSPKSPKASLTAQAILRRVESERDAAMGDLRRMTTERDCLRERLKVQQDQSIGERARLEQRANDLECKVCALNEERADIESRLDALKELNISQDNDIKVLRSKLKQVEEDLQITRCDLDDTRSVKNQLDASMSNLQRQMSRKTSDMHSAEDRIHGLENRISEQLETMAKQNDDITSLRATTTTLDREKDALQVELDERTERMVALEEQLGRRERELSEMRSTISDLEAKLGRAGDDLASSEREVRSLRRQLDASQAELNETNRSKDNLSRDSRRLQDDLSTMTRENQDVTLELEETMRSRDELKNLLKERDNNIINLENSVNSKERELQDILEQYRKVTNERDSAESKYRVMKDEAQALREELNSCDNDRKRQQENISTCEREISKHVQAQQSYEQQISCLTSQMAALEGECDRIRSERAVLQADLSAARDLNSKCETSKDHLARQLSAKNVEYEQLHSNFEDMNRELEMVHKHLETERIGNKNLEDLMATAREKEFQAQLNAQEQKSEGQLLRDKLALNESKLQSVNREVLALRDRASQLDAELDVAKRHLTNERYERKRRCKNYDVTVYPRPRSVGTVAHIRPIAPSAQPTESHSIVRHHGVHRGDELPYIITSLPQRAVVE